MEVKKVLAIKLRQGTILDIRECRYDRARREVYPSYSTMKKSGAQSQASNIMKPRLWDGLRCWIMRKIQKTGGER